MKIMKAKKLQFGLGLLLAGSLAFGLTSPSFAKGGGGGSSGGTVAGGGGGGGSGKPTPNLVDYKITGTIIPPFACQTPGATPPGYADVCKAFPAGAPFTLTYTIDVGAAVNLENREYGCVRIGASNPNDNPIVLHGQAALYRNAVTNLKLQLGNGASYTGARGDVTLENDTCLVPGSALSRDDYTIVFDTVSGLSFFPSFNPSASASVNFRLTLEEQAGVGFPNPTPHALNSTDLATAAPEQHLLEYNVTLGDLQFLYPATRVPSFDFSLAPSTLTVVP
jgi:hypothetical protein